MKAFRSAENAREIGEARLAFCPCLTADGRWLSDLLSPMALSLGVQTMPLAWRLRAPSGIAKRHPSLTTSTTNTIYLSSSRLLWQDPNPPPPRLPFSPQRLAVLKRYSRRQRGVFPSKAKPRGLLEVLRWPDRKPGRGCGNFSRPRKALYGKAEPPA